MKSLPFLATSVGLCCLSLANHAAAASYVLDAFPVGDLNINGPGSVAVLADFSSVNDITGVGITAGWTAVVADNEDGLFPWSLDLRLTTTSPQSAALVWDPVGGDVTIADYPLADFSPSYSAPQPGGSYDVVFSTPGVPNPWVSGLRSTTLYAMGQTDDVVTEYDGSVVAGPTWDRPFFIDGVSGLGPVVYDALSFNVGVSGGYTFESVIPSGNNFNFIYRGEFDPALPLNNLLDYGLGNGNAPNGTPAGTSRIDALLLAGETYHYVTSQFDRFSAGQDFETTVTGPGGLLPLEPPSGDFNGDGAYDCEDVDPLVAEIVAGTNSAAFDLTGDGFVARDDLDGWLVEAGAMQLASGTPYLHGDANLDGNVNGFDFLAWNANKFTALPAWCGGDFDATGIVDGLDFIIWNMFKFQSADLATAAPEPGVAAFFLLIMAGWGSRRRAM